MSSIASKLLKPILIEWLTFWFSKQMIDLFLSPALVKQGCSYKGGLVFVNDAAPLLLLQPC